MALMTSPRMRDVLEALDWVRAEMWRFSSPDFIRQRETERRVEKLCARLVQGRGSRRGLNPPGGESCIVRSGNRTTS
jgi:hypothetical protein